MTKQGQPSLPLVPFLPTLPPAPAPSLPSLPSPPLPSQYHHDIISLPHYLRGPDRWYARSSAGEQTG
jgi:hypothetical protein